MAAGWRGVNPTLFADKCGARNARRPVSRVLFPRVGDDHSSGTPVAGRLARPTRTATRRPACGRNRAPSLLGLAPGGVCPAASVARGAVRSYRTLSPLPGSIGKDRMTEAVCFLRHFPWGRPRRALPGTVSPWSPDFPPSIRMKSGHPAVWRAISTAIVLKNKELGGWRRGRSGSGSARGLIRLPGARRQAVDRADQPAGLGVDFAVDR